jgi:hypothetical protein
VFQEAGKRLSSHFFSLHCHPFDYLAPLNFASGLVMISIDPLSAAPQKLIDRFGNDCQRLNAAAADLNF